MIFGKKYKLLNIFLAISIILFSSLYIITIFDSVKNYSIFIKFIPVFLICFGIIVFFITRITKSSYQFFMSLMLFSFGISFLIYNNFFEKNSFIKYWPFLGILGGINLFFAGIYKYKKVSFGFVIPSVTLIVLCSWFLLFSLKIVSIPFKTFVIVFGPLLLIMMFVFIFIFYLIQKNKNNENDIVTFQDDELIFEKSEE